MKLNKQKIIEIILADLEWDLRSKQKFYENLKEAVIKADGAMQSHSDTYKFQYSQQAENVVRMMENIEKLISFLRQVGDVDENKDVVGVGDMIVVDKSDVKEVYLVVPDLGVMKKFDVDNTDVYMVSVRSPIGEVLVGSRVGGEVEFRGQRLEIKKIL